MIKSGYVIHIRILKQALNHGLIFKKFLRVIKFNQKDQLKPYIELTQKEKIYFEKDFFKLMNNAAFGKTI